MNETEPSVKPWQLIERLKRLDAKQSRQNQERLLLAYNSFVAEGITEIDGYHLIRRDAELRHVEKADEQFTLMAEGTMLRTLSQLEEQGVLSSRWEDRHDDKDRARLYFRVEPIISTE